MKFAEAMGAPLFYRNRWTNTSLIQSDPFTFTFADKEEKLVTTQHPWILYQTALLTVETNLKVSVA